MFIASLILGILGLVMGLATTTSQIESQNQNVADTNQANRDIATETNETNLQAVRETNAANVEQANLAYRRSLPINQVADLMQAGFSKHGALNKLAGGGVYTAPALQSATAQTGAPMQTNPNNVGAFSEIFQRLGNLPADFTQQKLVDTQIQQAQEELNIKRAEEKRNAELHQYNVWREQYGKDTALMLDNVSSEIVQRLLDSGRTPDEFKSFDSMVRSIGADNLNSYKKLPHLARTQLEQGFNEKFANARAEREQHNRDISAQDTHDLSNYQKSLSELSKREKEFDLSEKKRTQLLRIANLAQEVVKNKYTINDLNKNAIVRELGFENEKQIAIDLSVAKRWLSDIEASSAWRSKNRPQWLVDFVENTRYYIDKINPLVGLIKFGDK